MPEQRNGFIPQARTVPLGRLLLVVGWFACSGGGSGTPVDSGNPSGGSGDSTAQGGGGAGFASGGHFEEPSDASVDVAMVSGGMTGTGGVPATGGTAGSTLPAFDLPTVLQGRFSMYAQLDAFPEGPSWHPDGSVYVCARELVRIAPDQKRFRLLAFLCLGSVVLADRSLLVTGEGGLYRVMPNGEVALLAEGGTANDLTLDRNGTVFFTADGRDIKRMTPSGTVDVIGTYTGANGIEIDAAGTYLYVSGGKNIVRFGVPAAGAKLGAAIPMFANLPTPDGMAFDAHGHLWVALHETREVGIFDPNGKKELGRLLVPVEYSIQNLAFGGTGGDRLFVAGGRFGANAKLMVLDVPVRGLPLNPGGDAYPAIRMVARVNSQAF